MHERIFFRLLLDLSPTPESSPSMSARGAIRRGALVCHLSPVEEGADGCSGKLAESRTSLSSPVAALALRPVRHPSRQPLPSCGERSCCGKVFKHSETYDRSSRCR